MRTFIVIRTIHGRAQRLVIMAPNAPAAGRIADERAAIKNAATI